jgi:hypothetical protein
MERLLWPFPIQTQSLPQLPDTIPVNILSDTEEGPKSLSCVIKLEERILEAPNLPIPDSPREGPGANKEKPFL